MRRTGGTPAAALSTVTSDNWRDRSSFGNNALRFVSGNTGHTANIAMYTFPGAKPDFANSHYLLWVKIEEGSGVTSWNKATVLQLTLMVDNSNYKYITFGEPTIVCGSSGWYAFGISPSYAWTIIGSVPDMSAITKIGITVGKELGDSPSVIIGSLYIVPEPTTPAVLTIQGDGSYASHKTVSEYLDTYGYHATFYQEELYTVVADSQSMQSHGHLIASYCRSWGTVYNTSGLSGIINLIAGVQTWLSTNSLTGGRHLVHGVDSIMTESLWDNIIRGYADTIAYGNSYNCSPYLRRYMGRYHEFTAANKATATARLNAAVADHARMGILIHELTGTDLTEFEDWITNTVKPLVDAGQLRVVNVKEAMAIY